MSLKICLKQNREEMIKIKGKGQLGCSVQNFLKMHKTVLLQGRGRAQGVKTELSCLMCVYQPSTMNIIM